MTMMSNRLKSGRRWNCCSTCCTRALSRIDASVLVLRSRNVIRAAAQTENRSTISLSFFFPKLVKGEWAIRGSKHAAKVVPADVEQQPNAHACVQTPCQRPTRMLPRRLHECKPIICDARHHAHGNTDKNRRYSPTKTYTKDRF